MRVSDLVRDFIVLNSATEYLPAITWSEDQAPFDNDSGKVIFTKQTGRAVDAYVRQADVEVLMFSERNVNASGLSALYDDIELAIEYIKANFIVNDDLKLTITQDVTGPYITGQNRYFYRFGLLTYSE